eukprot:TRINITY_DN4101_c0_g2_i1.p1 TRINITY_DN4101_c0_g2~~TRINITY_DN4101_c0_g2_i1.p1  ORF type:complete len:581 (+),score=57.22 TRINITY_DN4101_c0_g2_i1:81-1823(+)
MSSSQRPSVCAQWDKMWQHPDATSVELPPPPPATPPPNEHPGWELTPPPPPSERPLRPQNNLKHKLESCSMTVEPPPSLVPIEAGDWSIERAIAMPSAAEMAKDYSEYLKSLLQRQEPAERSIMAFLEAAVNDALALNWDNQPQVTPVPHALRLFGSREYQLALPSSDMDVLLELPADIHIYKLTRKLVLQRMLAFMRADPRVTGITNAIEAKKTVCFRLASLKADFTVCTGSPESVHSPTRVTGFVRAGLNEMPEAVHEFARLVVDFMKRVHACWDRRGAIGNQLKSVHWVLITIAWYRNSLLVDGHEALCLRTQPLMALHSFLDWTVRFPFQLWRIDAESSLPFSGRPQVTASFANEAVSLPPVVPVLWLCDPAEPQHNLTERVDEDTLSKVRTRIHEALQDLLSDPRRFWDDSRYRWEFMDDGRRFDDCGSSAPLALKLPPQTSQVLPMLTDTQMHWQVSCVPQELQPASTKPSAEDLQRHLLRLVGTWCDDEQQRVMVRGVVNKLTVEAELASGENFRIKAEVRHSRPRMSLQSADDKQRWVLNGAESSRKKILWIPVAFSGVSDPVEITWTRVPD